MRSICYRSAQRTRSQVPSVLTHGIGGYFSGFKRLLEKCENLGFPIAELASDGSCVITKEENNTGGEVSFRNTCLHLVLIHT